MKITLTDRLYSNAISEEGSDYVELFVDRAYGFEDILTFETEPESFVEIELDPQIKTSVVYTPSGTITFQIPVNMKLKAYHPDAFQGERHKITMKKVEKKFLEQRRNLAFNGLDKRWETGYYPHAEANVVTRDEPWFEAKNAIDGWLVNDGHGAWPYQSWGGGLRDDLAFTLDFGREVTVDEVIIYLRADFVNDHDVNWESGTIEFSNGDSMDFKLENTGEGKSLTFQPNTLTWLKLTRLKREVSAAFTALTQIEVYGIEA